MAPSNGPFGPGGFPPSGPEAEIVTPGGSSITPTRGGGYRVCDRHHHCRRVTSLWEAQQLVQWAEVHHQPLEAVDSLSASRIDGHPYPSPRL